MGFILKDSETAFKRIYLIPLMKLKMFFLLALMGTASWAQNNNQIETLIKVWGFLKYHHPQVASGVLDWDSEFIEKLQLIQKTTDETQENDVYLTWLKKLKTPKPCSTCNPAQAVVHPSNVEHEWSNTTNLNTEVQVQLNFILENRNIGKNYFVQFHQKTKLPLFNNERPITSKAFPNTAQRLLALARYYNALNYFYPYKHLMTTNWNAALSELVPLFRDAGTAQQYQLALLKMNQITANSNAFVASDLIFEKIGKKRVPFKIDAVGEKWIVVKRENDSLAGLSSLQLGDEILEIAGQSVQDVAREKGSWLASSNEVSLKVSIAATLLHGEEDQVLLSIRRDGSVLQLEQKRYAVIDFYWEGENEDKEMAWKMVGDKTVWLTAADLEYNQINAFQSATATARILIVDLRDYKLPSGLKLADYLVPRARVFAQMIEPNMAYVGKFSTVPKKNDLPTVKKFFVGTTYVLIDEKTRGQAELLAMLLKGSDRVITVGKQSSGSLGYSTKLLLPGDVNVFFTGIGIQNSNGTEIQQKGIQPDMVMELGLPFDNRQAEVLKIIEKAQER